MIHWTDYKVGDLGEIITGKTPLTKCPEYFGDAYPFITPTDIMDNQHWVDTERFISQKGYEKHKRQILPKNAICFVCIASIGKMCITKKASLTNQQINSIIVNESRFNPQFVYYLLRTKIEDIKAIAGGVATPIVNKTTFSNITVFAPPLSTQQKIAAILSTYDDLIENNTRRIKILEEMAQAIYKEWFVNFRFPGHKRVKMVNSKLGKIPDGWEVVKVEDLVQRISVGKKYDNKTVKPEGHVPVLDQGQSGIIGYHDEEPGLIASEDNPIIVFANHTCYQRMIQFPFSAIQNVLPFVPGTIYPRDIYWLHWATKDLVTFNDYKGHWPEFMSKQVVLPPLELCAVFRKYAQPIMQNCYKLNSKNSNLRKTRDLLLPKLISGEIEV